MAVEISLAPWKRTSVTELADHLTELEEKEATLVITETSADSAAAGSSTTAAPTAYNPLEDRISSLSQRLAEEKMLPVKSFHDVKALVYAKFNNGFSGIALILDDSKSPMDEVEIKEIVKLLCISGIGYEECSLQWKTKAASAPAAAIAHPEMNLNVVAVDLNVTPDNSSSDVVGTPVARSGTFSLPPIIQLPEEEAAGGEVTSGRRLSPLPPIEATSNLLDYENKDNY